MTEMTPAEEVYFAAAALPPAERSAYLARACAGRDDLRQVVERMLAVQPEVGDFLEPAPADATAAFGSGSAEPTSDHPSKDEHAGAVIAGKYTLVEPIGEGGMGSVWRAKQTEPVKRFVAVKLIKAGMDSKQVLARFDAERQALALMDHPNIAKVLDGGLHEHRPYFVMELVKGVPITEYCDHHKLTPQQRLELFVQVCQAIQHAHQKGIIHRDIKPSNVLIALYDDKPVVKVIDFGVAKATGAALTERTIDTGFGGIVGTPQYMSPEQATFNNLDIDTRSDVYALGVLLYELLVGSPPFSRKELKQKGLLEILRVVREEEPPRPSAKLSTADALPTLSANRDTEPKKLTSLLRNELDWIVMKALEKDRTRRYETANGFAADVLRYLSGEAVLAHPPSTAYRVKKFVRRNKGQVIAASLVVLLLLLGIVGTTLGLLEARRQEGFVREETAAKDVALTAETEQRGIAEANARAANVGRLKAVAAAEEERKAKDREAERAEGERKAKEQAQTNLAFARKGNEILASVFASLEPKNTYATVGELSQALKDNLLKAVAELDGSAIGDPLTVASMQNTLGVSLLGLGEASHAILLFEKARATYTVMVGADHPLTLTSMNNLAGGYQDAKKPDKALPLFEETFERRKARLGADHRDTLASMHNLALGYLNAGQIARALPLLEETHKLATAKLGADHPDTLACMASLADGYRLAGNLDKALPLAEETLERRKARLGADHPDTLQSMHNLAEGYYAAGKLDKALQLNEETLKLTTARLGAGHPSTLTSMSNLAAGYRDAGKLDKALPLFEETLKLRTARLGASHPNTLISMGNLAECYRTAGKLDKALPLFEETLKLRTANLGASHPNTLSSMGNLGHAYCEARQGEKASGLLMEFVAAQRNRSPPDDPRFAGLLAQVSLDLLSCDQFATAETMLRECLTIREKKQPDAWTTFNTQSLLGGALLGQKKYADAEPLLLKGYEGLKQREKTIPAPGKIRLPEAIDRLIELSTATNKPEEAKKWRAERAKYAAEQAPPPREKK